MRRFFVLIAMAALAGCEAKPLVTSIQSAQGDVFMRDSPQYRGLKFARNRCSDCHSVETAAPSPRPSAPSFLDVVEERGADREAIAAWLRQPHDFPDAMYFEIPAESIDDLAAYMVTLKPARDTPAS